MLPDWMTTKRFSISYYGGWGYAPFSFGAPVNIHNVDRSVFAKDEEQKEEISILKKDKQYRQLIKKPLKTIFRDSF